MADDVTLPGTGESVATDDVSGVHYQRVKLVDGTLNSTDAIGGDATNGLDVDVTRVQGVVHVDDNSSTLSVDDGGGSLTVDGTVAVSGTVPVSAASLPLPSGAATAAKQPALGTAGTPSTDVLTVQGHASGTALKTDGSGVTQPVSAASLPLPSGASTAAKQPALGTAGTASADVLTVQGIASMTALKTDGSAVTQPVSGTVTAHAGTGPWPVTDNGGSLTVDGTVSITANSAVNVAQVAGTTADTNSGSKSAGTLRVVVATDQPQLTNALKVDGSAVTQPVSGSLTVSGTATVTGNKAEDAAAADGDAGLPVLGVRNDAAASRTSADGDYGMLALDSAGRVGVSDLGGAISVDDNGGSLTVDGTVAATQSGTWNVGTLTSVTNVVHVDDNSGTLSIDDGAGSITVDNAGTFAVQATVAAAATSIAKAEDVASADADVGVPSMAVRKATPANTSGTDGDYEFLQMSAGRLWTSSTIDAALPAGTNAIGKLAANSGVDIGDVDVTSVSGTVTVGGTAATDAAVSGNPLLDGGRASAAAPTAMSADGDAVPLWLDRRGALHTIPGMAGTATITSVNDTATSTSVLASNTSRIGVIVHNNSTSILYIKYGTTASIGTGGYTYKIGPDVHWEMPQPIYQGAIDGIWSADASGYAEITEMT